MQSNNFSCIFSSTGRSGLNINKSITVLQKSVWLKKNKNIDVSVKSAQIQSYTVVKKFKFLTNGLNPGFFRI